jgi:hypothetical protein
MEGKVTADRVLAALLGGKLPDDELFAGASVQFTDEGQAMLLIHGVWVEVSARVLDEWNPGDMRHLNRALYSATAWGLQQIAEVRDTDVAS